MKRIVLALAIGLLTLPVFAAKKAVAPEERFAKLDANHDGALTQSEYLGKAKRNAAKKTKRFAKLDSNQDGKLSREEYLARATKTKAKKAKTAKSKKKKAAKNKGL